MGGSQGGFPVFFVIIIIILKKFTTKLTFNNLDHAIAKKKFLLFPHSLPFAMPLLVKAFQVFCRHHWPPPPMTAVWGCCSWGGREFILFSIALLSFHRVSVVAVADSAPMQVAHFLLLNVKIDWDIFNQTQKVHAADYYRLHFYLFKQQQQH